jgi:hypothetical protein
MGNRGQAEAIDIAPPGWLAPQFNPSMNQPAIPPLIHPPAKHRWLWIVLVLILIPLIPLGGLALGVASYFRLSSDTRALRNELTKASGTKWRQQIGLNVGSMTLGAVRGGLSFARLDPKAQEVLRAARGVEGVEVGVYELHSGSNPPDRAAMLTVADNVMSARGWERVVGVLDGEQVVGVFLPARITSPSRMKCCVVVLDGRQLVVVSAHADLEPLLEFLRNQPEWRAKMRSLARR